MNDHHTVNGMYFFGNSGALSEDLPNFERLEWSNLTHSCTSASETTGRWAAEFPIGSTNSASAITGFTSLPSTRDHNTARV